MTISRIVFADGWAIGQSRKAKWILVAWSATVLVLSARHVLWRDEVRGLSLALQGDNVFAMLSALRGDGHPAMWHLLLRGAHYVAPTEMVLPVVAFLVAMLAVTLVLYRSPFGLAFITMFLLGRASIYEYSVMARNYGISMLLMFVFASLYSSRRDRGVALGLILFLLANSNTHSVILVAGFMLFWLIDVICDESLQRATALRNFALNALIVSIGIALCALTVYPPFNDAAQVHRPGGMTFGTVVEAVLLPSISFGGLFGSDQIDALLNAGPPFVRAFSCSLLPQVFSSAVLFGSALGLLRRPAALAAAWMSLIGFSLLFTMIYPGAYRHQALWIVFLLSLYWISSLDQASRQMAPGRASIVNLGLCLLCGLVALQAVDGLYKVAQIGLGHVPESRSRDLARLIDGNPRIRWATIIADPDYLVEPLPYYIPNRTYLLRERRFGNIVHFTQNARVVLTLDDIAEDAASLRKTTAQPVVVLLADRLDPTGAATAIGESYNWKLVTTPQQVQSFLSRFQRIGRFPKACCSDESFDVYLLN